MPKISVIAHLRDILLLPFTVTVIIPYLIVDHSLAAVSSVYFKVIGLIVGLAGLLLFLYTVFLFKTIGKGTLAPWSKKQKLVVVSVLPKSDDFGCAFYFNRGGTVFLFIAYTVVGTCIFSDQYSLFFDCRGTCT